MSPLARVGVFWAESGAAVRARRPQGGPVFPGPSGGLPTATSVGGTIQAAVVGTGPHLVPFVQKAQAVRWSLRGALVLASAEAGGGAGREGR